MVSWHTVFLPSRFLRPTICSGERFARKLLMIAPANAVSQRSFFALLFPCWRLSRANRCTYCASYRPSGEGLRVNSLLIADGLFRSRTAISSCVVPTSFHDCILNRSSLVNCVHDIVCFV